MIGGRPRSSKKSVRLPSCRKWLSPLTPTLLGMALLPPGWTGCTPTCTLSISWSIPQPAPDWIGTLVYMTITPFSSLSHPPIPLQARLALPSGLCNTLNGCLLWTIICTTLGWTFTSLTLTWPFRSYVVLIKRPLQMLRLFTGAVVSPLTQSKVSLMCVLGISAVSIRAIGKLLTNA